MEWNNEGGGTLAIEYYIDKRLRRNKKYREKYDYGGFWE